MQLTDLALGQPLGMTTSLKRDGGKLAAKHARCEGARGSDLRSEVEISRGGPTETRLLSRPVQNRSPANFCEKHSNMHIANLIVFGTCSQVCMTIASHHAQDVKESHRCLSLS